MVMSSRRATKERREPPLDAMTIASSTSPMPRTHPVPESSRIHDGRYFLM